MKYFFPIHLDGDNRGCEGIAKGTAILLGEQKENLVGLCSNIELDQRLGISNYITLQPYVKVSLVKRVVVKLCKLFHIYKSLYNYYPFNYFVSRFSSSDILISTGGDMMCYGNNQVITTNEQAVKMGCKTILWGCSMGPENLTPEKEAALRKFSLLYARESLTYDFFKSLGLKNVICFPDPAFVLEPEACSLPICFGVNNKVIGINLSNFTVGADNLETPFGYEIKKLLSYILEETDYHVLMIPHVFWKSQDDRILSKTVINSFKDYTDRFTILHSSSLNYLQIRYVISNCHMFIGGRTHAVVSAYSTCVPAIALGYSIKSKGIAKDLGIPQTLVVDTKHIRKNALLEAFQYVEQKHDELQADLARIMPSYKHNAIQIKQILKQESFIKNNG